MTITSLRVNGSSVSRSFQFLGLKHSSSSCRVGVGVGKCRFGAVGQARVARTGGVHGLAQQVLQHTKAAGPQLNAMWPRS